MSRSTLCDVEVYIHRETDKAWFVSGDGDESIGVWVPKSQAEFEPDKHAKEDRAGTLTLPEWLAIDKGLI